MFLIKTLTLLLFIVLFSACSSYDDTKRIPTFVGDINDTLTWYSDMQNRVYEFNVSFASPNTSGYTFQNVLDDTDPYDSYEPYLDATLYTESFSHTNAPANAVLKQKGKSTRDADYKSFRIKLNSTTDLLMNERVFQLNKHFFDPTRIRNKLFMDLFIGIPDFMSLKTRFVKLNINNEDYGLFTHVENVAEEYLKNRGFNEKDNLYKAQNFSFYLEPQLALSNGKPINKEAFESVIELQSGEDYPKLIEMLEALNRENVNIDAVIAKYFNRENYLTWFAINIITGNLDTISQNFFLYNPRYSDTFYFIPWDYDGAGEEYGFYNQEHLGLSIWWDVSLHKAFLKIKKNRDDLDAKINYLLANYLTPERYREKIDSYKSIIKPILERQPDSEHLNITTWEAHVDAIPDEIARNVAYYRNELGRPMPFWQETYIDPDDGRRSFSWGESYDFEGDEIIYDLYVSQTPEFTSNIIEKKGLTQTVYKEEIPSGTYYMKVVAYEKNNPSSYTVGFEIANYNDKPYDGVLEITIE